MIKHTDKSDKNIDVFSVVEVFAQFLYLVWERKD